jgi:predicted PurR-regulated permease PerM
MNLPPFGLRQSSPVPGSSLSTVLLSVIVVAALYFGREVLVPFALAVLLSFVLAPLVRLLQAYYIPRIVAVLIVVVFAFGAIFALGALMLTQVNQLASDLPRYQSTLREKIQNLRGASAGTSTLERASDVLKDLSNELEKPNNPLASPRAGSAPNRAIPVEVKQPDPTALQTLVGPHYAIA